MLHWIIHLYCVSTFAHNIYKVGSPSWQWPTNIKQWDHSDQWYHLTCLQARMACLKRVTWCTLSAFPSFSFTLTTVVLLQDRKAPRSSRWSWNSPALWFCGPAPSSAAQTSSMVSVPCSSTELAHSASLPWLWAQLKGAASVKLKRYATLHSENWSASRGSSS